MNEEDDQMKNKRNKKRLLHFLRESFVLITDRERRWARSKISPLESETPCLLANINSGYIILSQIFLYLDLKDLQSAACVCKAWNHVATKKTLWKSIRLEGTRVIKWSAFKQTLLKQKTEELDLWEMDIPQDLEKEAYMWKKMSKAVAQCKSLTRVDLGRCPPEAFSIMVKVMPQLTSLVSLDVQDGLLDLKDLLPMEKLTELRLNSFSNRLQVSNLKCLKELTNLKTLSITEVESLGGIEDCLPPGLENLELGPWHTLSIQMSRYTLPSMTNLKKLRMEQAWQSSIEDMRPFFETVSRMSSLKHLELVNFPSLSGFDRLLARLDNIHTLVYIMNVRVANTAVLNSVFLESVYPLKRSLKQLFWELPRDLEYTTKGRRTLRTVPLQLADYVEFLSPNDFWWNVKSVLPITKIGLLNVNVTDVNRNVVCA